MFFFWLVGEFYYYVVCYNADFVRQNTDVSNTLIQTLRPTLTLALLRQRLYRTSEAPLNLHTCITVVQYTIRVAQKAITTLRRLLTNAKDKNKPEDRRNIKSTETLRHVLHCTYSTDYCQRLSFKSWFTNLEQTPLNRSQHLPAPYKRLIDGL